MPINHYLCNMKNPFYNDIYEILRTKGEKGLPVGLIAKMVYNRHANFFNSDSYEWTYQHVRYYLWAQSKKKISPFTKGTQWGWYALKIDELKQLELQFTEPEEPKIPEPEKSSPEQVDDYPTLF